MSKTVKPSFSKIFSKLSLSATLGVNLATYYCLISSMLISGTNNPWIIDIVPVVAMTVLLFVQIIIATPSYVHYYKHILNRHIVALLLTVVFCVFAFSFNLHLNKGYEMSFFSPAYIVGLGLVGIGMVISYLNFEENPYVNKEKSIDLRKLL
ncbi:hypothetical protein [Vibrio harveyi]|uniref:hypothetical protein n=1 Tax=Vibrio harveyi TaxID=669 RepID=UPI00238090FA|nr:hypothetical protein [Vibrio harveyi]